MIGTFLLRHRSQVYSINEWWLCGAGEDIWKVTKPKAWQDHPPDIREPKYPAPAPVIAVHRRYAQCISTPKGESGLQLYFTSTPKVRASQLDDFFPEEDSSPCLYPTREYSPTHWTIERGSKGSPCSFGYGYAARKAWFGMQPRLMRGGVRSSGRLQPYGTFPSLMAV